MDKVDQTILSHLLVDARSSLSFLAKKANVSKATISYRLDKLEDEFINHYFAVIPPSAVGLKRHVCFLQLTGFTLESEQEFFALLEQHSFLTYISPLIGRWNVAFDVLARNRDHLQSIIQEITNEVGLHLKELIINSSYVEEETYYHKILSSAQSPAKNNNLKVTELDRIDLQILQCLSENARMTYVELGQRTSLTAVGVGKRVRKLENAGVIQNYTFSPDVKKFGYELYVLQLKVSGVKQEQLKGYLRAHPQVLFLYQYLGHQNWNLDVGILVKDPYDFRKFMVEMKHQYGDATDIYDIYVIADVIKDNVLPSGAFQLT